MPLSNLPRVDALAELIGDGDRALRVEAARHAIGRARAAALAGEDVPGEAAIVAAARAWIAARSAPILRKVINATGVVVHTNLGRAPLPAEAVAPALGYCNLEYDLERGERGSRRSLIEPLLVELTGAEAALVVNNCAAALVLALASLRRGQAPEVIVSRGELVEIGGSFRIPEIIQSTGVRLREVGTTNRTHAADYAAAIGPDAIALLRVHPSNFKLSGFVARPTLAELVAVAHDARLPLLLDLGSDALHPPRPDLPRAEQARPLHGPDDEPGADTVAAAVAAGVDVVMLSGDKLLGGPQAGILLGGRDLIDRAARHPLMRALRPDKLALAALEHVLRARAAHAPERVPVLRMLALDRTTLAARAERLAIALAAKGLAAEVVVTDDPIGGGSHPEVTLPGAGIALTAPAHLGLDAWHAALRRASAPLTPVVATIAKERLVIALRTVPEADEIDLVSAIVASLDSAGALI